MNLTSPVTVFFIDDNPIDRENCRRLLREVKERSYEVVEYGAFEGALGRVEEIQPDCILLDYHLHDGNGLQFLTELESIGGTKRYPVVVLTATGSTAIAVEVLKSGAQDYLSKEAISPELLHLTIESAIGKAKVQRQLEDQREEMARLLRAANLANARKDHFLATLSHELRTPLTPILTMVSQLDFSRFTHRDFVESFTMIRRNIELEARLIDDLLDLTRISSGKLEVKLRLSDLHEILSHAAVDSEAERERKNIRLEWHLYPGLAELSADPGRILQVFGNLIKNATKFTMEGGCITVTTRLIGRSWEIEIADTGIGLQPGTEEAIFAAFEQGGANITRRFGGLGLGLAISKALVEAHHGSIHAANRPGQEGAVFTIRLPIQADIVMPALAPVPPVTANSGVSGTTILLVEDHVDSAFYLKRLLEGFGYHVLLAKDATSALRLFHENSVDYLISDLGLPDRSGLELMKKIAAIRQIPAISLSGYGMEVDTRKALAAGFSVHLTKPVDFDQVLDALRSISNQPSLT